eukprot:365455-Chlamydomonas_euryale.AAC.7
MCSARQHCGRACTVTLSGAENDQPAFICLPAKQPASDEPSLKERIDKFLIADFFLVMFVLAWLVAGVLQSASNGGESFLLDAWYAAELSVCLPEVDKIMVGPISRKQMSLVMYSGKQGQKRGRKKGMDLSIWQHAWSGCLACRYPLWPLLWQPAIGILMLGALVSGGLSWLSDKKAEGN